MISWKNEAKCTVENVTRIRLFVQGQLLCLTPVTTVQSFIATTRFSYAIWLLFVTQLLLFKPGEDDSQVAGKKNTLLEVNKN